MKSKNLITSPLFKKSNLDVYSTTEISSCQLEIPIQLRVQWINFVSHLVELLHPNRVLYLAIEKIIQFTLSQLKESAPAFDFFIDTIHALNVHYEESQMPLICLERIDIHSVPLYFDYKRSDELELYKITSSKVKK